MALVQQEHMEGRKSFLKWHFFLQYCLETVKKHFDFMYSKPSLDGSLQQVNILPTERTLTWHNPCERGDSMMLTGFYCWLSVLHGKAEYSTAVGGWASEHLHKLPMTLLYESRTVSQMGTGIPGTSKMPLAVFWGLFFWLVGFFFLVSLFHIQPSNLESRPGLRSWLPAVEILEANSWCQEPRW